MQNLAGIGVDTRSSRCFSGCCCSSLPGSCGAMLPDGFPCGSVVPFCKGAGQKPSLVIAKNRVGFFFSLQVRWSLLPWRPSCPGDALPSFPPTLRHPSGFPKAGKRESYPLQFHSCPFFLPPLRSQAWRDVPGSHAGPTGFRSRFQWCLQPASSGSNIDPDQVDSKRERSRCQETVGVISIRCLDGELLPSCLV